MASHSEDTQKIIQVFMSQSIKIEHKKTHINGLVNAIVIQKTPLYYNLQKTTHKSLQHFHVKLLELNLLAVQHGAIVRDISLHGS